MEHLQQFLKLLAPAMSSSLLALENISVHVCGHAWPIILPLHGCVHPSDTRMFGQLGVVSVIQYCESILLRHNDWNTAVCERLRQSSPVSLYTHMGSIPPIARIIRQYKSSSWASSFWVLVGIGNGSCFWTILVTAFLLPSLWISSVGISSSIGLSGSFSPSFGSLRIALGAW